MFTNKKMCKDKTHDVTPEAAERYRVLLCCIICLGSRHGCPPSFRQPWRLHLSVSPEDTIFVLSV